MNEIALLRRTLPGRLTYLANALVPSGTGPRNLAAQLAATDAMRDAAENITELFAAIREAVSDDWLKDDTMDHMPGIKALRNALAKAGLLPIEAESTDG